MQIKGFVIKCESSDTTLRNAHPLLMYPTSICWTKKHPKNWSDDEGCARLLENCTLDVVTQIVCIEKLSWSWGIISAGRVLGLLLFLDLILQRSFSLPLHCPFDSKGSLHSQKKETKLSLAVSHCTKAKRYIFVPYLNQMVHFSTLILVF